MPDAIRPRASTVGANRQSVVSAIESALLAAFTSGAGAPSGDYSRAVFDSETGEMRIVRGGSWVSEDPSMLRCAHRHEVPPDTYATSVGFRIVCG